MGGTTRCRRTAGRPRPGLRREYPRRSVSGPEPSPRGLVLLVDAPDTPPVQVQILDTEPAEADRGHVTAAAVDATRRLTSATPTMREFSHLPARVLDRWHERLAHQVTDPGTPEEAIAALVHALRDLQAAATDQE